MNRVSEEIILITEIENNKPINKRVKLKDITEAQALSIIDWCKDFNKSIQDYKYKYLIKKFKIC